MRPFFILVYYCRMITSVVMNCDNAYTLNYMKKIYIYGKHAVSEALTYKTEAVLAVHLDADKDSREIAALAKVAHVPVSYFKKTPPRGVDPLAVHQGVVALVAEEKLLLLYKDFMAEFKPTIDTVLVILDGLYDPHNVGAVIRSASAFGAAAILIPKHDQAPITGVSVKTSAGMVFRVPLIEIGNINMTIRDLKERGFWIYGLEGGGTDIAKEKFDAPTVIVVGNEAEGIKQKTREHCDVLLSIPISARCESLNASNAAAVALYAWSLKHPSALK